MMSVSLIAGASSPKDASPLIVGDRSSNTAARSLHSIFYERFLTFRAAGIDPSPFFIVARNMIHEEHRELKRDCTKEAEVAKDFESSSRRAVARTGLLAKQLRLDVASNMRGIL